MTQNLFSPYWHRIALLKPGIRADIVFSRHHYRDSVWYLFQDLTSGQQHRFNPHSYRLIAALDGRHSIEQLWQQLNNELGDEAPTQDEILTLLGQLFAANLLTNDLPTDSLLLFQQQQKQKHQKSLSTFKNPFAIRIPLVNPDPFVSRWIAICKPFFSRSLSLALVLVVLLAAVLAFKESVQLRTYATQFGLDPYNIILLILLYPAVKGLHELGHAFAVKMYGGRVLEMGVIFLVMLPVPYVDASQSAMFKDKYQRMVVSFAGIWVELVLAALAFILWINLAPGLTRDIAFTITVIGGLSTLLFNGNPLLRFDGYYILADALEIPDLGPRANNYYSWLIHHYLFSSARLHCPANSRREHLILASYGISALLFRLFILYTIATFIAGKYFF